MNRKEFQNMIENNGTATLCSIEFFKHIYLENDALEFDETNELSLYIPVPDKTETMFNLELEEYMEFINLYAVYCPENDTLQFHGNIYNYDGEPDFPFIINLTNEEQKLFYAAVDMACLKTYKKSFSVLWEEEVTKEILSKCQKELVEYKQNLLNKNINIVYNLSFETSYKEEIVALMEKGGILKMLTVPQLYILYNEEKPLHFIYDIYSSWDDNADFNEHIETVIWTLFPNPEEI